MFELIKINFIKNANIAHLRSHRHSFQISSFLLLKKTIHLNLFPFVLLYHLLFLLLLDDTNNVPDEKILCDFFIFFQILKSLDFPMCRTTAHRHDIRHGRDELKANSGNAETLETPLLRHWSIRSFLLRSYAGCCWPVSYRLRLPMPRICRRCARIYGDGLPYNRSLSFSFSLTFSMDPESSSGW